MNKQQIYRRRADEVLFGYIISIFVMVVGSIVFNPNPFAIMAVAIAAVFYVIAPSVRRFDEAKDNFYGR